MFAGAAQQVWWRNGSLRCRMSAAHSAVCMQTPKLRHGRCTTTCLDRGLVDPRFSAPLLLAVLVAALGLEVAAGLCLRRLWVSV